ALHAQPGWRSAEVRLPGPRAGWYERLETLVAVVEEPVADGQHLCPGLEGRAVPRRRSVGPAQRQTDSQTPERAEPRQGRGGPVQPCSLRPLRWRLCPARARQPPGVDAGPGGRRDRRPLPPACAVSGRPAAEGGPPGPRWRDPALA